MLLTQETTGRAVQAQVGLESHEHSKRSRSGPSPRLRGGTGEKFLCTRRYKFSAGAKGKRSPGAFLSTFSNEGHRGREGEAHKEISSQTSNMRSDSITIHTCDFYRKSPPDYIFTMCKTKFIPFWSLVLILVNSTTFFSAAYAIDVIITT